MFHVFGVLNILSELEESIRSHLLWLQRFRGPWLYSTLNSLKKKSDFLARLL